MVRVKISSKPIILIVLICIAVGVFAGCGSQNGSNVSTTVADSQEGSSDVITENSTEEVTYPENGLPKDQEVTLKIGFAEQGYGRAWYDACVESFTKKFPNVKFETTYSPKIEDVVQVKVAANDDDGMFDIFHYNWQVLADAGKVEPLEDIFERTTYDLPDKKLKDVLIPGIYEGLSFYKDKHLYYMPLTTYISGLFFDQSLFEQNGWNKSPKTWEEFQKLCEDIKAKGIIPITTTGKYLYEKLAFAPKQFELAEMNGNKDYINNFKNYNLPFYSTPENKERWKREYEMGQKGYIDPNSAAIDHTQSQMMVIQHKAAMVVSGDWIENEMKDSVPEGYKWGFMAIPFISDPNGTVYIGSGINTSLKVYKNKPELNKKWAKEFLLWLTTIESQQNIVEKGGAMSIRGDYGDDPSRVEKLSNIQKSVSDYLKNHKTAFIDFESSFNKILTHPSYAKARNTYENEIPQMTIGKKDYIPVLEKADQVLKEAVDAYNNENK